MQCMECCQGKWVGNQEFGSLMGVAQGCPDAGRWSRARGEASVTGGTYTCETAVLCQGELHVVDAAQHCRISCMAGAVWVTSSSRTSDYILKAGECVLLQGRSKIIISGCGKDCQVRVSRS
jgi:hypothetical protein